MQHNCIQKSHRSRSALRKTGALLFCASLCIGTSLYAQEERGPAPPEGEGKELFITVCSQCHTLKSTLIMRDGQKGWEETVDLMVLYGAQLTPPEADRVTRYLATQLGPRTAATDSGTSPIRTGPSHSGLGDPRNSVTLPEGPGKELVAAHCALCHNLEKVVSSKRSKADWEATTINMEQRGMKATPDEMQTMISYLQANFSAAAPAALQFGERSMHTGKEIFTQKCSQCHSVLPDQVQFGPSLYGEMRKPQPKMTDAQIRTTVRDGKGKMPPVKDLSKEDTDNLLDYIRSL